MKSVVVIYKSKYGSTEKYAKWLSELLSCDIFETKNINIEKVMKYDTIVLGGGLYACNIAGISFFKKIIKNYRKKSSSIWCRSCSI